MFFIPNLFFNKKPSRNQLAPKVQQSKCVEKRKTNSCKALKSNLKHLEFIAYLEAHLDKQKLARNNVDFLLQFNQIKQDTALNALKAIQHCNQ